MTLNINKQTKAEQDLIDIWLYTFSEWNEHQADKYLDQLDSTISKLINNPKLGMDCGYIKKGYRRLSALQHEIYYYLTDHSIEIVRVLHKRMNEKEKLRDTPH